MIPSKPKSKTTRTFTVPQDRKQKLHAEIEPAGPHKMHTVSIHTTPKNHYKWPQQEWAGPDSDRRPLRCERSVLTKLDDRPNRTIPEPNEIKSFSPCSAEHRTLVTRAEKRNTPMTMLRESLSALALLPLQPEVLAAALAAFGRG